MTHESEQNIEPVVADWFRCEYGFDNVETQVYLPSPRWFCDIVVDIGFARLYVEVESRESAIRDGLAQAASYAATDMVGIPVLVTPEGHVDEERREVFSHAFMVPICEFDIEEEKWV